MTQIKAYLMEKNIATNCFQVTVPVLAGWTKKPFGRYATLKLFPSDHQVQVYFWWDQKYVWLSKGL